MRVVVSVVADVGDEFKLSVIFYIVWVLLDKRWTRGAKRGGCGYASLSLFVSHLVPLAFRVNWNARCPAPRPLLE